MFFYKYKNTIQETIYRQIKNSFKELIVTLITISFAFLTPKYFYETFEMSCIYYKQHMTFQVREFEFNPDEEDFTWNFKLANINNSQLDFYSQQLSTRSLLHLTQDIISQVDQALEKKNKKCETKNRSIRKLCQKMIKQLKINLQSFAEDIKQEIGIVRSYFAKSPLEAGVQERMTTKCRSWIIATWLTLPSSDFYKTTHRFMQSFIQDGKKTNPDFEMLNELYAITLGDEFNQLPDPPKTRSQNLILIDINLNVDDKFISQNFLWDSEDISNIRIKTFASHFLRDTLAEHEIQLQKDALLQLEKQTKIQIRTQILYKTLLKKYASILLNFSSMDIPNEVKQYTIFIELKLIADNGSTIFEDEFQWDILNQNNNVEQFVASLVEDYQLPNKYISELCYKIRTQINSQLERKFDLLVKTFKSIHKDRQSPKLNTQTISVLRKNVTFAMDVSLPCTDKKYKPNSNFYFNNSDLFSLLSRNIDILPEQFQEILMCKQSKPNEKQSNRVSKNQSNQILKLNNQTIQANPYLSTVTNNYNMHNIWRKALNK